MTTQTQFTDYTQAAEFLKEGGGRVIMCVKNGQGYETQYECADGTIWTEHDVAGDQYTLKLVGDFSK